MPVEMRKSGSKVTFITGEGDRFTASAHTTDGKAHLKGPVRNNYLRAARDEKLLRRLVGSCVADWDRDELEAVLDELGGLPNRDMF